MEEILRNNFDKNSLCSVFYKSLEDVTIVDHITNYI